MSEDLVKIFYIYSREEDTELKNQLDSHLSALRKPNNTNGVDWRDCEVIPGGEWDAEIEKHLHEADIILLLISSNFMASEYHSNKMETALARHDKGETRVIPIILRPVDKDDTPFSKLQELPTNRKAVALWSNRDEACVDVKRGVGRAIKEIRQKRHQSQQRNATGTTMSLEQTAAPPIEPLPELQATGNTGSLPLWMRQPKKPVTVNNQKKLFLIRILLLLIAAIPLIAVILGTYFWWINSLYLPDGLGVVQAHNGAYVGVNDGIYHPFDIQRQDNQNLRQQAIDAIKAEDPSAAMSHWSQYLSGQNTNDAEVKIYLADQRILAFNHVTLIVGLDSPHSPPTPDAMLAMRSALQGAYLAQKEFNDNHSNIKLRLLLASTEIILLMWLL